MKKVSPLVLSVLALPMLVASNAAAGTAVNVNINGYLPAPSGVHVYMEGGRPYYRERGRIVYLDRDQRHHRKRHGHAYGHREHEGDRDRGHGRHGRHD